MSPSKRSPPSALEEHVEALTRQVTALLDGESTLSASTRQGLERLRDMADSLAGVACDATNEADEQKRTVDEILDVLFGLAQLDFSRRAPIRGDGPLAALAASANMLTEELEAALLRLREARDTAEKATRAKDMFLASMSHEIRTPLTALLGFADLLAGPKLSESDRLNYAMVIQRNGVHLLSLINDILDLSLIETHGLSIEHLPFSLAQLLGDVAVLMQGRADERGLAFTTVLEGPVPAVVSSDPTRLRQVLLNLVGNAIKFTLKGSVKVSARFEAASSEIVLTVTDTGAGILPEHLARLFQPFEQGDISMSRRFGGSGLGLAISKRIVETMGGAISVESQPSRETTFVVRLPVVVPAGTAFTTTLSQTAPDLTPDSARLPVGRVLVVEDGEDNQDLIAALLRGRGLTATIAPNGEIAVAAALAAWKGGEAFDLVLMDMQMPVMDGYEATRQLRAASYPFAIVALTAHAIEGERERCLAAGCDEYQRKPIDRIAFTKMLQRFLGPRVDGLAVGPPILSDFAADPVMTELVSRFVRAMPERIEAMLAAAREGRTDDLRRLAHHLRGSAGGYGFPTLSSAAERLEQAILGKEGGAAADEALRAVVALGRRVCGEASNPVS